MFFEIKGVAVQHFKWPGGSVKLLRKQIAWMRFIIVPSVFVVYMSAAMTASRYGDSLARLALIILMVIMSIFFVRVLHPKRGALNYYFIKNSKQWWVKLAYLWFFCAISIPMIIVGFSLMGYFISALELHGKVVITLRVVFFAVIIHGLIIRWLTLANRQMALNNARKKRQVHELNAKHADLLNNEMILNLEEEILDIPKINEQTVKIVNILIMTSLFISIWLIWKNIFHGVL